MDTLNSKRYPVSDKYFDAEGTEVLRGSYTDFESLPSRHLDILNTIVPNFENDKELLGKLELAAHNYEKANYESALNYLNWLLIKETLLEPFLFYYKKICERVVLVHPIATTAENKFRCKWCGSFTSYVNPNESTFGLFSGSNSCSSCGRMYPMPSWLWDSPDGRAYSYYRQSFIEEPFYEEFEEDYEPNPICKRRLKTGEITTLTAEEFYDRGMTNAKIGNYIEALSAFNKAVKLDPNFVLAYLNRGIVKDKLGDKDGELTDYNKAIELNPSFYIAYYSRGHLKHSLGNLLGALNDYSKAIKINPNFDKAYVNRGLVKNELSQYKEAIKDYNKAIELNPNNPIAYCNRGVAKGNLGNFQKAIIDYNKAIELNPNFSNAYINRGLAKYSIRNKLGACKDWDIARELGNTYAQDLIKNYCK